MQKIEESLIQAKRETFCELLITSINLNVKLLNCYSAIIRKRQPELEIVYCLNGKDFPNGKVENFPKWLKFPNQEVNRFPDRESGLCALRKWPWKVKKLMPVVKEGE